MLVVPAIHTCLKKAEDVAGEVLQPLRHHLVWQDQGPDVNLLAVEGDDVCNRPVAQVRIGTAGETALSEVGSVNTVRSAIIPAVVVMLRTTIGHAARG